MCLYSNKEHTLKMVKRIKNTKHKRILAWKVVERGTCNAGFSTEHVYSKFYAKGNCPWEAGVTESNCTRSKSNLPVLDTKPQEIGPGIHVFLRRNDQYLYSWEAWLPVWCELKDLIASNYGQAVFTRVTVTENAAKNARKDALCHE